MTGPTLGELFEAAERHFAAAEACRQEIAEPAAAVYGLRRLLVVLEGYLQRTMPGDGVGAVTGPAPETATALLEVLRSASGRIAAAATELGEVPATGARSAARLADAAGCLAAGCDLLASHTELGPGGVRVARSDWAGHLADPQVQAALIAETGQWSRRAASFATWLASGSGLIRGKARADVASASELLWTAADISGRESAVDIAAGPGREILRGFRHVRRPERIPPDRRESAAELRDGIVVTAGRLRSMAFTLPREAARSSPALSGPAWARTALAGAVVSHISRHALQALAVRSSQLTPPPASPEHLATAARAIAAANDAWRHAAQLWQVVTTDTQAEFSPVTTEADDLVLRIGRLTFADPGWMPARARRAALRTPVGLAADAGEFAAVVGAIHHATDALARLARADYAAIGQLAAARRFYMPNTVLWDERYADLDYASAPADRLRMLHGAYRAVASVCLHAARAMDALAAEAGAPSVILAAIRPAAPVTDTGAELAVLADCVRDIRHPRSKRRHKAADPAPQPAQTADTAPGGLAPRPSGDERAAPDRVTARIRCGPVETRMKAMGVTDVGLLLQAAAIDRAGHNLLSRASSPGGESSDQPDQPLLPSRNAAALAAADTPADQPSAAGEARQATRRRAPSPARHSKPRRLRQCPYPPRIVATPWPGCTVPGSPGRRLQRMNLFNRSRCEASRHPAEGRLMAPLTALDRVVLPSSGPSNDHEGRAEKKETPAKQGSQAWS